jgi:ABC-type multidrug transport system ATPase subunit
MSVLEVKNLTKNYGAVKALQQVNITIPKGSIYGILGPNGSGKTTMLGIVLDVLKATDGNYLWFGKEGTSAELRRNIGTLLETPNFYPYLSGQKNLEISAAIKNKPVGDIERVLEIVNLAQRKTSKFSTYSLGMKQRLAIASALLGDPDVLVFDEPTNGLDPAGIAEIRELIKKLSAEGKTIIMASHILDEVEKVCTHVTIIQKGKHIQSGSVNEIIGGTKQTKFFEVAAEGNNDKLAEVLKQKQGVVTATLQDGVVLVECVEDLSAQNINQYCFEQGIVISQLNGKRKSLETRFLEITGTKSDR